MSISRRLFLQVGSLGATLSLSDFFRLNAAEGTTDSGRSAVLVFLGGGPAHQDTFDMKPNAPEEYRGQFSPIRTSVPGIEICEHMPKLAQCADKIAIIRSLADSEGRHDPHQCMTGRRKAGGGS